MDEKIKDPVIKFLDKDMDKKIKDPANKFFDKYPKEINGYDNYKELYIGIKSFAENPFPIGTVVRLASGSPKMTVCSEPKDGKVYCEWFVGTKLHSNQFSVAELVKCSFWSLF